MAILLSSGIYDKKKILRDNPNLIDATGLKKDEQKKLIESHQASRRSSSSSSSSDLRSSKSEEKLYTPLNPNLPDIQELARQVSISQNAGSDYSSSNVRKDSSNWWDKFNQAIQKTEKALGSNLPGGYGKEELKTEIAKDRTRDLRKQNEVYLELYEAELERIRNEQIYKEQSDIISQQWYEQFGLFQSEQEKLIRNLQIAQAGFQEQAIQLPNTVTQYEKVTEYIRDNPQAQTVLNQAQPESFDWKKGLLIGGLALGGLLVISKKI